MATSPLFGWEEPDDVDLVKDGAAAIRTLGNAIDTSMGDLLGGTTGQVLSKASNSNMDFTWVTSDDANAIQNAIVDAKGDLIAASAADTPARLAVGNNGETLVADSSATTGLAWTATPNATNPIINSSFDIWQRGTSVALAASTSIANSYTADRFQMPTNASQACTVSRQATGDTTNLPNIQYCARFQRNSGQTGTGNLNPSYNLETADSIPFAGKTITFSFYARKGANYSPSNSAIITNFAYGTGTDQNIQNGYTGQINAIIQTTTLTTTWQRFTYTAAIPSTATQLGFYFTFAPTGTAGATDYFEITGIMINVGSTALPYRRNAGTLAGELAACQRYYWRRTGVASSALAPFSPAYSTTGTASRVFNPQTMRVAPTSVDFSDLQLGDDVAGPSTVTSVSLDGTTSPWQATVIVNVASGLTQYRSYVLRSNTTSSFIGFSAEL